MDDRDIRPGEDWRRWEIDALVAAYFDLLQREIDGDHPVKADINRGLQGFLPARSRGSIEYKLQNVSGVLNDLQLPFIDGYKPARNYQAALRESVLEHLDLPTSVSEQLARYGSDLPKLLPAARLSDVLVGMPPSRASGRRPSGMSLIQGGWGAIRDAALRELGEAGESWVVGLERAELTARGRPELAARVEWTSRERGDGYGYDIASFEPSGGPIQIEVKTTNFGPRSPFYVSRNELEVSGKLAESYRLYRVFDFRDAPKLFVAPGPIEHAFSIDPFIYEARLA